MMTGCFEIPPAKTGLKPDEKIQKPNSREFIVLILMFIFFNS